MSKTATPAAPKPAPSLVSQTVVGGTVDKFQLIADRTLENEGFPAEFTEFMRQAQTVHNEATGGSLNINHSGLLAVGAVMYRHIAAMHAKTPPTKTTKAE